MRRRLSLVLSLALLAGCGGGGDGASPGGEAGAGETAENPRVAAVLDCLGEDEESGAYVLEENAISLNTDQNGAENGVEIYFDDTEARAAKRARDIESTGIGIVYRTGTVVESWITRPQEAERAAVTACIEKDPGPGAA